MINKKYTRKETINLFKRLWGYSKKIQTLCRVANIMLTVFSFFSTITFSDNYGEKALR